MKPYKTLLILLVFMVFLYGPSLFFSSSIKLPWNIVVDIPQIQDLIEPLVVQEDININSIDTFKPVADSSDISWKIAEDSILKNTILPFPEITDSSQLRVLYYGDSQLEGDRITDRLRILLREQYGGSGPGLLSPTMISPYTRTAWVRSSSNWEHIDLLSPAEERPGNCLGPMFSISRFNIIEGELSDAWIKISPSSSADSLAAGYKNLRLFYSNLSDSLLVSIYNGRALIETRWLPPVDNLSEASFQLPSPKSVDIRFRGNGSPDIYGFSIESNTGLILDNISLRGSSGTHFSVVSEKNLKESLLLLQPKLIILQFGLNIVLNIRKDYTFYERRMYNQLMLLKRLRPETELLMIGVSDMARQDSSGIHSYPNLPAIIRAQKSAAKRAGVEFWDAREAMGGNDAIVAWREESPPLANADFTHITYKGGHKFAELLYNDIFAPIQQAEEAVEIALPDSNVVVSQIPYIKKKSLGENYFRVILSSDPDKPLIFTTAAFWIFLLVMLVIYSFISGKPLIRNTYLFLFSLFFYYKSGGAFFILLIISTLTDYILGILIYGSGRKGLKRFYVFLSLFVNLGMLAYYKYTWFVSGAINDIVGTSIPDQDWLALLANKLSGSSFNTSSIILPIGISFFTFQTISYTIDIYREKTEPVRNILDFGFYVSFFPQLVAGPIVRASEFIPQLYRKFVLTTREWSHALFLIISGLIKKIIVSDYIAVHLVDNVFTNPGAFSGPENLLAVYGYGLQIYCDFSGYTDIAIGVALMLGFRLPVNFNSPYKASNITDFWRRWHISLSRWLKDYLYISLGGNRKGRFRTGLNLFITMLLGGLWHGAAWSFIIWGALHGLGLIIHKLWKRIFSFYRPAGFFGRSLAVFITFNFVSFCWIFFRADNMEGVGIMLERIANAYDGLDILGLIKMYYGVIVVIIGAYILHFLPARIKESYRGLFIRMPLILKMIIVYIIAIVLYNFQNTDIQPFIYFRF